MRTPSFFTCLVAALVAVSVVESPRLAAQKTPPAPAAPARGEGRGATPSDGYTYESGGRRDPFMSLNGSGTEPRLTSRPPGAAGLLVGDLSVRGIVQSRNGLFALVQGPDSKTYAIHQGEKLLDGTVKSITTQGLVIVQDVTDPLSLVKQREVRKQLRSAEGATP